MEKGMIRNLRRRPFALNMPMDRESKFPARGNMVNKRVQMNEGMAPP